MTEVSKRRSMIGRPVQIPTRPNVRPTSVGIVGIDKNSEPDTQETIDDSVAQDDEVSSIWMGPVLYLCRDIWGREISPFAAQNDAYCRDYNPANTNVFSTERSAENIQLTDDERLRRETLKRETRQMEIETSVLKPMMSLISKAMMPRRDNNNRIVVDAFGIPMPSKSFRDLSYCGSGESITLLFESDDVA